MNYGTFSIEDTPGGKDARRRLGAVVAVGSATAGLWDIVMQLNRISSGWLCAILAAAMVFMFCAIVKIMLGRRLGPVQGRAAGLVALGVVCWGTLVIVGCMNATTHGEWAGFLVMCVTALTWAEIGVPYTST